MPTKKKDTKKTVLRNVLKFDKDGTIDTTYTDDAGMKTLQIANANKGLLVTFYDKDATATAKFVPVDAIKDFLLAQNA